ncbi:MAG: hypothetical protein ABIL44_00845, partial [candidate division WOR-3 bacterium]
HFGLRIADCGLRKIKTQERFACSIVLTDLQYHLIRRIATLVGTAFGISDFGLRIAKTTFRISDCENEIADFGLRIAEN